MQGAIVRWMQAVDVEFNTMQRCLHLGGSVAKGGSLSPWRGGGLDSFSRLYSSETTNAA